jgi:signal transduction histidine kinase
MAGSDPVDRRDRDEGMREARARRIAWWVFLLWALFFLTEFAFELARKQGPGHVGIDVGNTLFALSTATFPIVGLMILARLPRNRVGWILMAIGFGWAIPLDGYGDFALSRGLPGGTMAIALSAPLWAPSIGLMGTSLLLRFPDGKLLSRRWRKVELIAAIAILAAVVLILFSPGDLADSGYPKLQNPLGSEAVKPILTIGMPLILLIPATIIASAVGLVLRFRRSRGNERLQMKWLAAAAAGVAVVYLTAMVASLGTCWCSTATSWVQVIENGSVLSFGLIPVAIGFAILRHRLYEIDVVINKALVYGSLAAFITAVYVAIVVGIGTAVGSKRNLALSILATAVVAVGFQPVRDRVQRFANRLVYGKRATPYEVLSEFSGRMAHAYATEDLLPRMARIVAEGTGASRVDVWLRVGPEFIRGASWPDQQGGSDEPGRAAPVVAGDAVSVAGAAATAPVRHQGDLLGVIAVQKHPGDAVKSTEAALLQDLASQAGLVLRNVRLIQELRTSRQRLVSAQDEERRRLERNLHDGAQQRLVSIALVLRMAKHHLSGDGDTKVDQTIDQAAEQLALALQELRELARGIHPAILTERGLGPALGSLAERSTVPATVEFGLPGRLPSAVEAAAYFVASEALANVGKYSKATAVTIKAEQSDGALVVEVTDDGVGGADPSLGSGLRGLEDRVAAVDGRLEIVSPAGQGTRLRVTLPVPELAEARA